ncbi:Bud site selection protein, Revert to axial protein 1 [Coemansia sp. RSA 518]|nr:Bud site selection protein, Revert to axial protein 1 [Coemansia sp. RSA 518]KAJ2274064.1 Bud site selection protein, Revert to axial protein 1 [Coemansia sp. RSA 371]
MNQDSPSFQASSPTTTTTSPKARAEHDTALNNATALFGRGAQKQLKAEGLRPYDAGSGGGSTVHGSPAHERTARLERLNHVSGGTLSHEAKETQIRTSLLDPHPIVVPPPGSRLSFAGANSPVMAHLLRALPSLDNTLQRQAQAPLCLYNYWQYLADIEAGAEELEFWLALSDYEAMYRQFAPTHERHRVESGALGVGTRGASARLLAQVHMRHMDTFDTETQELDAYLARVSQQTAEAASKSVCAVHAQCVRAHQPFTARAGPALDAPSVRSVRTGVRGFFGRILSGDTVRTRRMAPHEEVEGSHLEPLLSAKEHVPTEPEMRRAAELLYFHYILVGAPASLHISSEMRAKVASRIERDSRFDTQLFAPAKRHAYEAMWHESHVRFQRERLFHNITRGTAALRIVLGLALVMVALAFQVALVLLDVHPKGWRWLPISALWTGLAYAVAGVMRLDPIMAILGRYEATAWSFGRVIDSTVRHAHLKRAAMIIVVTAGVAALITLVLFLVPGHRL